MIFPFKVLVVYCFQIDEYNGNRDLVNLHGFVEKQLSDKDQEGAKDEL